MSFLLVLYFRTDKKVSDSMNKKDFSTENTGFHTGILISCDSTGTG